MKYFTRTLLITLISLYSLLSVSAPHPTTGQSLLNRLSHSPVFSQFGFQLKGNVELPWIMDNSEADAKEFNLLYGSGRLNIKSEVVSAKTELDNYIKRYLKDSHIYKEIDFEDKGQKFHFTEKVKALTLKDFEELMEEAGIYLLDIFGDYKLKKFHKTDSERLIMIFK